MTKYGPALAAQESPWNSAASWDHPTPERQNFSVERITNCRMSVTIRAAGQGRGYERVGGRALRTGLLVVTDLMRAQRGSRLWSVRRRTLGLCRGDRHKVARRQDRLSRQALFVNAKRMHATGRPSGTSPTNSALGAEPSPNGIQLTDPRACIDRPSALSLS
jgi:hypothetical protein